MPVQLCIVQDCPYSDVGRSHSSVSFHGVKRGRVGQEWRAIAGGLLGMEPPSIFYFCSIHFHGDDFRGWGPKQKHLHPHAVPVYLLQNREIIEEELRAWPPRDPSDWRPDEEDRNNINATEEKKEDGQVNVNSNMNISNCSVL